MNKRIFTLQFIGLILAGFVLANVPETLPETPKPVLSEGVYFTDVSQTKLYSGIYREYYENGALKLELFLEDGRPEGTYVVYFENGRPNEVRSYHKGQFHGVWRTYNSSGLLKIGRASCRERV